MAPGQLLANVGAIRHLPGVIVHGRYDMICPVVSADRLARAWPEADFVIVPDAGHSVWEPGIAAELVRACEMFKGRLSEVPAAALSSVPAGLSPGARGAQ